MLLDSSLIVHSRDPLFSLLVFLFPLISSRPFSLRCILVAHERIMQVLRKAQKGNKQASN